MTDKLDIYIHTDENHVLRNGTDFVQDGDLIEPVLGFAGLTIKEARTRTLEDTVFFCSSANKPEPKETVVIVHEFFCWDDGGQNAVIESVDDSHLKRIWHNVRPTGVKREISYHE